MSADLRLLASRVQSYAEAYGIRLDAQQTTLLLRHFELVCHHNQFINLTRITAWNDAITKHIIDSLLFLTAIPPSLRNPSNTFIDIGTGAGYPGIPLAVASSMSGVLLDAIHKKIAATNAIVHDLGLDTQLVCTAERAELHARSHSGIYEVVVARAVADLSVLIEYATPLMTDGGYLVLSKGVIDKVDLEHASTTASICGLSLVSCETFSLPEDTGLRTVITYQAQGTSHVKLPRRVGQAQRKPLWQTAKHHVWTEEDSS